MDIEKKYDELIGEVCEKTGVNKSDVIAVMEELGLKESLQFRHYQSKIGGLYGLPNVNSEFGDISLKNLRVASSVVSI